MGQTKALPRLLRVSARYAYSAVTGLRYSVDVTTNDSEHPSYVLDMTVEQYRTARNLIADTGSAPIPTGEHA